MTTTSSSPRLSAENHDAYLAVIPLVAAAARRRFAFLNREQRDEAVAEALAAGFLAYASMKRRGRERLIHTPGFTRNAIRHVAAGRHVGSSQAARDVMSDLGRRRHRREVRSYSTERPTHARDGRWLDEAMADRRTPIPEQVAIRVDGGRWLSSLSTRDRRMVQALAAGDRAVDVAERFKISPARLCQLRGRWAQAWRAGVGVTAAPSRHRRRRS